jgi:hypothetical protein
VYTVFAPYSPSHLFSPPFAPCHWFQTPRQDLFFPLVLWSCKRKKNDFFKIAMQGDFVWHFHIYIYIYYNPNWFISSNSPLLMLISTGLKILYSFLYRKYNNHLHLLNIFLLPSLSCM